MGVNNINPFMLMKKIIIFLCLLACFATSVYLIGADHIDSPDIAGSGTDITDYYAFESPENADNVVFVINVKGLLAPSETGDASFEEDVMLELNIDNSASKDNIEDLVLQAMFQDGKVKIYGPVAPSETGVNSTLMNSGVSTESMITAYGQEPQVGTSNGMKVFAGPRDDPFFFDLNAYKAVIAGTATAFGNPGMDTFAGTNVLSVVIELPKSSLGSGGINTWVTANRKM
jgi:hypothetical protein